MRPLSCETGVGGSQIPRRCLRSIAAVATALLMSVKFPVGRDCGVCARMIILHGCCQHVHPVHEPATGWRACVSRRPPCPSLAPALHRCPLQVGHCPRCPIQQRPQAACTAGERQVHVEAVA